MCNIILAKHLFKADVVYCKLILVIFIIKHYNADSKVSAQSFSGRCGGSEKSLGCLFFVLKTKRNLGLGALGLLGLLGEKHSLDVGQNTTLSDGHSRQKLVQLLVVADGQLKVTGDDSGLLVVAGSVACQLKDLSSQVLEDGGQVDWSTGTDTLGIVAFAQKTVDTADRELQTSTG